METPRLLHRIAALILLLEALPELRDPLRRGDGDSYRGGGLLLMPHERSCRFHRDGRSCSCVLAAAAELERLLQLMRGPEPRLRRQVLAWFVEVERRGRWERRGRHDRKRRFSPFVYRRMVVRRPYADRALAMEGVGWLAERWGLRDLRGELVEPHLLAPGLDAPQGRRLLSAHSGLVRPEFG